MADAATVTLTATPSFTVFSGSTGFTVLRCKTPDGDTVTVTGQQLPDPKKTKALCYEFGGRWKQSAKYGDAFAAEFFEPTKGTSQKSFVSYLGSLKVGWGVKMANAVWNSLGENCWKVIENDPKCLLGISYGKRHISQKDLDRLLKAMKDSTEDRRVYELLSGRQGFEFRKISKLIAAMRVKGVVDIAEKIKQDPYACAGMVDFSILEALANEFNAPIDDPRRLASAMRTSLGIVASRGHTCVPAEELLNIFSGTLTKYRNGGLPDKTLKAYIRTMCERKRLVYQGGYIFSAYRKEIEQGIVDEIVRLNRSKRDLPNRLDQIIDEYEGIAGITLADSQRAAVKNVFGHALSIVTGGPGTGKSTITKAVLYVHKVIYGEDSCPVLLAPTGKASRRMSECNDGFPASTIHSAIGYQGEGPDGRMQFSTDDDFKIEGNLIVVDEVSMIDNAICCALLQRIPDGATVVFVGDPQQLPSVGAGNVLYEMIRSQGVSVATLSVIFRQKGGGSNPIIENAAKIRDGDNNLDLSKNTFFFVERESAEDIENTAIKYYLKVVEKYGIDSVLLLCPYRKAGDISVNRFNKQIQAILNPYKDGQRYIMANGISFREKDRVMQTKNTPQAKNGDVGVINRIESVEDEKGRWKTMAFIEFNEDGNELEYGPEEMADVDLAYACTVHKSQGSEAATVIMTVAHQNPLGLKRNLIYTGVTRAKKNVVMIGQRESLKKGIEDNKTDVRYTLLGDRLHQALCINNQ